MKTPLLVTTLLVINAASLAAPKPCQHTEPRNAKGQRHGKVILCGGNTNWEEFTYVNGVQEGWTKQFRDFKLERETMYKNDKPEGPFRTYHLNGKLESEGTNKAYQRDGLYKEYSYEGNLKLEEHYLGGKLHGVRKTFYEDGKNGKPEEIANYTLGERDGKSEEYYPNGKLRQVKNYQKGKWTGEQKEYSDTGKLMLVRNLKDGSPDGWELTYYDNRDGYYLYSANFTKGGNRILSASFHANGQTDSLSCYRNGEKTSDLGFCKNEVAYLKKLGGVKGLASEDSANASAGFYANGKPKEKCTIKDGKRTGKCESYDEEGNVTRSGEYRDGNAVGEHVEYQIGGKIRKEARTYENGKLAKLVTYYNSGEKSAETTFRDDHELLRREFYQNGNVKEEKQWTSENRLILTEYHDNGKVSSRVPMTARTSCNWGCYGYLEKDGKHEHFDVNGELVYVSEFKDGKAEGKSITYYPGKKVHREETYKADRVIASKEYDAKGALKESVEYFPDGSRKVLKSPK